MNQYLAKLRALDFKKTAICGTDKTDKTPVGTGFVSFVSSPDRHFSEIKGAASDKSPITQLIRLTSASDTVQKDTATVKHDGGARSDWTEQSCTRKSAPTRIAWTAEDWRAHFDERARIFEHEGGLARTTADARAFEACVIEWLNHNPTPSQAGRCAWCGNCDCPSDAVLPFGTEPGTHSWLHAQCWPAWHRARRADATAALKANGLTPDRPPRNTHG